MIYIGADHQGYNLKEEIKKYFDKNNIEYKDCGAHAYDPDDDYPDFAFAVGEEILKHVQNDSKGVLICKSGEGMAMAANKIKGVRAALCHDTQSAKLSREHNNANILVLNCELNLEVIKEIINIFLNTKFSEEDRHVRRIKKINDYENSH